MGIIPVMAAVAVEIIGMGNYIATGSDDAQGRGSSGGRKRGVSLREADLHLVPGRIFSNDGSRGMSNASSSASIYTQQGRKGASTRTP